MNLSTAGSIRPSNACLRWVCRLGVLGHAALDAQRCLQILQETYPKLQDAPQDKEAWNIFRPWRWNLGPEAGPAMPRAEVANVYTRNMYIKGPPINDSFHFGQTLINDYGRPYQQGFNALDGFTARAEGFHFSLDVRGEYQHAPGRGAIPNPYRGLIAQIDSTPWWRLNPYRRPTSFA